MKSKTLYISLLLSLSVALVFCTPASSMHTGFATREMNADQKQVILFNIDLTMTLTEPRKESFLYFAVREDGWYAIGSKDSYNSVILVYDANSAFQYAYAFNCSGKYALDWDGSNIIIYFVRGHFVASFDAEGTNIEMREIENTIANNSYWNHSVYVNKREANGCKYAAKNDMGILNLVAVSYSRLFRTDCEGNETLL